MSASDDSASTNEFTGSRAVIADRKMHLAILLLLVSLGWFAQGSRPLWETSEGRYTAVAMQMIRTGDWLAPRLNHEVLHFTKPPLVYWLIAASVTTLGVDELAVRLPNAVAWLALVFMLASLGRRLAPERPLLTPVIWCSSLFPFVAVNIVTTDFILTAAETLAVLGFVSWWQDRRQTRLYWMWLGFGLAFLVKGPPGLLPLLPILVFAAVQRWKIRRLFLHPALVLFFVVGFSWYLAAAYTRPDLLDYWFGSEITGRVTGEYSNRNGGPFGWLEVYGPVIIAAMLPWAALAPFGRWKTILVAAEDRFLLIWIVLPLGVFFLSSSRMPLYLLPLTVPAAVLLSRHLPPDLLRRKWFRPAAVAWLLILLSMKIGAAYIPSNRDPQPMAEAIRQTAGRDVDEVHFVDTNGWYGLTFYMGVEVEQVTMLELDEIDSNPAYRSVWDELPEEFREDLGDPVVYVVPDELTEDFSRQLRKRHLTARTSWFRGRNESFVIYQPLRRLAAVKHPGDSDRPSQRSMATSEDGSIPTTTLR